MNRGALWALIAKDGRAVSATDFAFDGVGHLRFLRVAAQADLRPVVQGAVAVATPPGALVILEQTYQWVGRSDGASFRSLDVAHADALAASADGTVLAVVDLQPEPACAGAPADGHLRWQRNAFDDGVACLPGGVAPILPGESAVAVDGGGSRALVSFSGSVWLADLKARTASELVLLPDGVHALVVDPGNDQLTLIE